MRWFKHFADAHDNLKFQDVWERCGPTGYALFWVCCELISSEIKPSTKAFCINSTKNWKKKLRIVLDLNYPAINRILGILAENNLINQKALTKGNLCIPKMKERRDEYTEDMTRKQRATNERLLQDKDKDKDIYKEADKKREEIGQPFPK